MSLTKLVLIGIQASVILNVFALGLDTSPDDYLLLLRRPRLLVKSLIAMSVVMPVFAVAVASLFTLPPPVKVAIVALALSPIPPLLPKKLGRVGGTRAYGISLLAIASLLSIVLIPVSLHLLSLYVGRELQVPVGGVIRIVLLMAILPLGVGMILRRTAPRLVGHISHPTKLVVPVLLALSALPLLLAILRGLPAMLGTGALLSLALFSVVGLAVGDFLGGPDPNDRTVLALATSARHPGIAATIAVVNFPDPKSILALVLVYLIIAAIVAVPYNTWRRRRAESTVAS